MKNIFFTMLALLAVTFHGTAQTTGTIPNETRPANELWQFISPQMSTRHMNQPSVFDGYLLLAGNAVHEVWDISDPTSPIMEAELNSTHSNGEAESHQITYGSDQAGNYYLATITGLGIDIWNMNDVTAPSIVSELILPGINYGDVAGGIWGVSWQGDYIFVGATDNGVYVVDVSDPANPNHVSTISRQELGGVSAGPVFALGDLLVVTNPKSRSGIATVDISSPNNPRLLDSITPSKTGYIGGFYGTHVHIEPFVSLDVTTDPRNITENPRGSLDIASEYFSFSDDIMYLGGLRNQSSGIWKYDISDVSNPQLLGRVEGRFSDIDDQFSCPIGNLIVITDDQRRNGAFVGGAIAVHDSARDTKSPSIKWLSVEEGAINQSRSGQIGISFSEWIEFKSVDEDSLMLRPVGGDPIPGKFGSCYTMVSFASDAPLLANTEYELVLPAGGIADLVGNTILEDVIIRFTTGSDLPTPFDTVNIDPDLFTELGTPSVFEIMNPNPDLLYQWEFGDGATASGQRVTHTYSAPGRHNVQYTVSESANTIFEAELADLNGVAVQSQHSDFTGTGYGDFGGGTNANTRIRWTIDVPAAITTDLTFRYALSGEARPLNLVVNGGSNIRLPFNGTGGWNDWGIQLAENITLQAGTNTIELRASAGSVGPNVDHLQAFITNNPELEIIESSSFVHIVHRPLTDNSPTSSKPLLIDNGLVWAVNPDSDSVSAVDTTSLATIHEISVVAEPKAIARAIDGRLWVVSRKAATISIIDPSSASVDQTIALPYASQPVGIAISPDGQFAYVTLSAIGQVAKINTASLATDQTLVLGSDSNGIMPEIRGVAITSDSSTLYITRFISPDASGEVYEVNASTMNVTKTIPLEISQGIDGSQFARGLPNYLTSITISPDGVRAWVPSKKDNIQRGGLRDGSPLENDVTVRAITSTIDLSSGTERIDERIDYDNSDRCHDCTFSPFGDLVFISMPGNQEIQVVDSYTGGILNTLTTQEVPEGSVIDAATNRLYILNFMSRSITVYNITDILSGGATAQLISDVSLVSNEPLSPEVLLGKQLFYDATSTQLNENGYMSCASCHLDGGHDGRTYDFSEPMGEGFRNTIDLRGRAGTKHGRIHWTGNFDEIHDFENQIRILGDGFGLMSDSDFNSGTRSDTLGDPKAGLSSDLDALSAYVTSLSEIPVSPYRESDGSLTSQASRGKTHFQNLRCADCHSGEDFTNSPLGTFHDVGTLKVTSGDRLGGNLAGIDTPTLKGIWNTAPYLHDGSANTLRDVLVTANPDGLHGAVSSLSSVEVDELIAYLKQIDDFEEAIAPLITGSEEYMAYVQTYGLSLADADPSVDPDGDGWTNEQEFVLGATNPNNGFLVPQPIAEVTSETSGDEFLQISWLRRAGGVWQDGAYSWGSTSSFAEASTDLEAWDAALENITEPVGLPAPPTGYFWTTSRLLDPTSSGGKAFMRLGSETE